ncbi:MAG: hypothetical protein E7163_02705 [Firmicutes bacterium]|nr:hypothetical protein [Bacillota bacterium]
MSLVSKLKNILFEEEEVEIPVIEKKEKKEVPIQEVKEIRKDEERTVKDYSGFYEDLEPAINEERKMEEKNNYQKEVSEREIFKSDNTFNFPAFDEEEFESVMPKRTNNVMDYERKKQEKRIEYKRVERKEETSTPKAKFKPSPIISPVYGILDKNYTPEDITSRTDTINRTLDVDSVRKKAFGSLEETPKVKEVEDKKVNDDKLLEENLEKSRTIDELLKDSSDEIIEVKEDFFEENTYNNIDSLENVEPEHVEDFEEDTLESDLFDLIDSMYENREDGE